MKIEINIERKHLYGVIVLLTLGFFIIYTIGTPVKKSTGSHPLQQIAVGVGSNPLDSVDSDADGLIDNSDNSNACNGDSVCEVKNIYATGNISISDGNPQQFRLNVSGKILATTPLDSDPDNTVVTKGYLDAQVGDTSVFVVADGGGKKHTAMTVTCPSGKKIKRCVAAMDSIYQSTARRDAIDMAHNGFSFKPDNCWCESGWFCYCCRNVDASTRKLCWCNDMPLNVASYTFKSASGYYGAVVVECR